MNKLEALERVRDEAYGNWREMAKVKEEGEHQREAARLGRAIDEIDKMIVARGGEPPAGSGVEDDPA